ncbi:TetR/AcrR family transcriptional regulator [Streptomyces microflavus]|uniref:TetR/AcrR family transcriptional regulator n=1 Tax=Streptomyces microflavus TaxID=1919 RepID=UPI0035D9A697
MTGPTKRGPYAKGIERRRQILEAALDAYAESDSSGPSLRAIAARVGISERGLLHYFPSRDELFVAILAERDAADRARFDPEGPLSTLSAVAHRSARTPGLVRLFSEMAAAAPDPEHPAHAYFELRYRELRRLLARMMRRSAAAQGSTATRDEDADFAARMFIAASDGLQQQWLLDPSIKLEDDLEKLAVLLAREGRPTVTQEPS